MLSSVENIEQSNTARNLTIGSMLLLSACFGLITGLVEGLGLLAFHGLPWFTLNSRIPEGVSVEILWISPVVNLCLFLALGLVIVTLSRVFPRLSWLRVSLFLFSFMAVADWAGLTGRIGPLAVLVLAIGFGTVVSGRLYQKRAALLRYAPMAVRWAALATLVALLSVEGGIRLRERIATSHLPTAAKSSPNVLVILVDTLRADHLSTYGYARSTSPHFDRIAQQGVLFQDAISTSSWTLPAHQGLLTGRYPHEHGPLREQPLKRSFPTLAQVLDERGYRTAAFSANTDFFNRRAGFDRGFLHFEDYFYSVADSVYRTFWGRLVFHNYVANLVGLDEIPGRKKAADVNRSLFHWLDRDHDKPFFAFLNYLDVHGPYIPEQPYRYKFANSASAAKCSSTFFAKLNPFHRPDDIGRLLELSPPCFQLQVDAYDGAISYVDDQIASVFSELARRGLDKNTLVVITSDHGESFGEHGLVSHGTSLYREQLWVPLIYWWPGHVPAGQRIERPISSASLPATILDLLGEPDRKDFPVPSLAQLWEHPGVNPDWPYPLSEMAQDLFIPKQFPGYRGWLKSLADPQWHLIVAQADPEELYDYVKDPIESQNLADTSKGKSAIHSVELQLWNQASPNNRNQAALGDPRDKTKLATVTK